MNIHLTDKMTYYLTNIFLLEDIKFIEEKTRFFLTIQSISRKKLIKGWEESLEESFKIHIVISLALLYALQRDKQKCEYYLRLAHQKKGVPKGADIIRCILYCELSKFDEALYIIKNLPMAILKMAFVLRIKADIYFAMKEYKIAESLYRKMLDEAPNKSTIFSRLGEIYLLDNDLGKAKELFMQAIKLDNKNIMAHFYLGDIYKLKGDVNKAKMEYGISAAIDLDSHLSRMAQQKLFLLCAEKLRKRLVLDSTEETNFKIN